MNITRYRIENKEFDKFLNEKCNPVQRHLRERNPVLEFFAGDYSASKRRRYRKMFLGLSRMVREEVEQDLATDLLSVLYEPTFQEPAYAGFTSETVVQSSRMVESPTERFSRYNL